MSRRNKKPITPEERPVAAAVPSRKTPWRLSLVVLGCLVLAGLVTTVAWRWHIQRVRVETGLPALPDFSGKPARLRELIVQAQTAVKEGKDPWAAVAELGRLYHANDFRREAEACWRLLQTEDPGEARWSYYLADLRRTASDYAEMASLLEKTVELDPNYAPAWLQLAAWELKNGRLESAESAYRRRLALVAGDAYANFGLARVAVQSGRREEARRLIEQLIKDHPDFPPARNLYAEMLAADGKSAEARMERWRGRESGRFREADDPWLHELRHWCYDPKRLYVLATMDYQTSQSDHGASLFQKAIDLAPDDPDGYEQLGDLYVKLGQPEKAIATLREGLKRSENRKPSVMLYVNLSHAYRMLKQPEEALRVAREGVERAEEAYEIYDAVGVALGDLNRHEEAIAAFREALARHPNDSNTNYNLSISLLALGRHEEAYVALQRSLRLQPSFPKALVMLARMDLEAGRLDTAETYVRTLYDAQPGVPQARQLMGAWHMRSGLVAEKRGDLAAAEQHYRAGLAIDPDEPELHVSLGVLCLTQGRVAEAIGPLEVYHRLKPTDPSGALYLGQAYAQTGRTADAQRILGEGLRLAERAGNTATANFCREILQHLASAGDGSGAR